MFLWTNISLKARFACSLVLLMIANTLVTSLVISKVSSDRIKDDIGRYLADTAFQVADKLDREMWSRSKEVEILASLDIFHEEGKIPQIQDSLNRLQQSVPIFSWIGFTNAQGLVLAASNGILLGKSLAQRPVYFNALENGYVGDVHDAVLLANLLPNPTGEAMKFVDISVPLFDDNHKLLGVLAAHLSWAWVDEIQESFIKPMLAKDNIELFIVSKDGTILLGNKESLGKQVDLPLLHDVRKGRTGWAVETWPDGKDYLTGASFGDGHLSYPGLGWTVLTRQHVDYAYAPLKNMQALLLGLGTSFTLLLAAVGVFIARKITRPLQNIVTSAQRLRDGEQVDFPTYRGIPDIEILSASLQEMLDSLTRTKAERDDMKIRAHVDQLTLLPNRAAFEADVEELEGQILRQGQLIVVLFLDLDGFKQVNDTLGHDAGDFVLRSVAVRLRGCLRTEDRLARLGGDEFVALVTASSQHMQEEIEVVGKRIISAINNPIVIGDNTIHVGCSIGAACYPRDGEKLSETVRNADSALYQAKANGKNQLAFYKHDIIS